MGLEYVAGQNIFCISIGQNVYFVYMVMCRRSSRRICSVPVDIK